MATIIQSSTLVLNGVIIDDYGDGDQVTITPTNNKQIVTHGANGSIIKKHALGDVNEAKVSVLKYSDSYNALTRWSNDHTIEVKGTFTEKLSQNGTQITKSFNITFASVMQVGEHKSSGTDASEVVEFTIETRGYWL